MNQQPSSLFGNVKNEPLRIVDTRSIDDELLDTFRRVSLFGNHDATGEEETVIRHALDAILLGPFAGQVRIRVIGATEAGTSDKDDVCVLSNLGISGEKGRMEVFAAVVTSCTAAGPLKNDRVVRV